MNNGRMRAHTVWLAGLFICSCLFPPAILKGESAKEILGASGIKGGLIVHLGCGNAALTAQLRAGDQYFVHGLDTNTAEVAAARNNLIKQGIYGPVSVDQWDGEHLPYADNLVNLIIADEPENLSEAELLRALAPKGVALLRQDGQWKKVTKP